nr:hypothetical protein [Candidatus Freyarchaeota archaeon]
MISLNLLYQLIIYEILIAVLLLVIGVIFAVRWREKRSAALKYLALTYFVFIFGALFAAYGHTIYTKYWGLMILDYAWVPYLLTGYIIPLNIPRAILIFDPTVLSIVLHFEGYPTTLVYQWSASLIAAAIGHLFIYLFTLSAFKEVKRKYVAPYAIFIGAVIFVLIVNLYITINWFLAFTVGLVTQGTLIYYAIKAMRLTESKLYKRGFLLISFTAVIFILFFGCYLVDSLLGGWTIFLFVGWTLVLISAIPTYVGYVLPDWFRRRYEKPKQKAK